jgi:AcrR family transcriptional regulator
MPIVGDRAEKDDDRRRRSRYYAFASRHRDRGEGETTRLASLHVDRTRRIPSAVWLFAAAAPVMVYEEGPVGGPGDPRANWRVEDGAVDAQITIMSEHEFDDALIAAAFRLAGESGWAGLTIADAAQAAELPLAEARARFPGKHTLLRRFGERLDQAAMAAASHEGPVRDQVFDLLMGRFDAMKAHRDGIRALLRYLPSDPATAMQLACATKRSMRWMLHAAGQPTTGVRGSLRLKGLLAVWMWVMRAFERDESEDLSATMAALDTALGRAHRMASWIGGERAGTEEPDEPAAGVAEDDPPVSGAVDEPF